jgi:uncharacterized protein (TIGR03435 family)
MIRSYINVACALSLSLTAISVFAQTPAAKPAFEVATVKPSPPIDFNKMRDEIQAGRMPRFGPHVDGAQAVYIYMTLKDLIGTAYDVKPYQINGPSWLAGTRFDIEAKLPDGASKDDAPKMLQALLEDRFKLVVHRETQERQVLALLVAKDGPKLKESTVVPEPLNDNDPPKPGEMRMDTADGPIRITRNPDGTMVFNLGTRGKVTTKFDMQSQAITLDSDSLSMPGLAEALSRMLQGGGRQVVDMTGLKGNYQVSVDVSFADLRFGMPGGGMGAQQSGAAANASPATAASDPSGVGSSVNDSVKKLGLKLEPRKAPVEELIIDHAEKTPTED